MKLHDGTVVLDLSTIHAQLARIGVSVQTWPVSSDPEVAGLLAQPALSDEAKERVLVGHDDRFRKLQADLGYQSRDLVVLHPDVPNLDAMLARFEPAHTHDDDEVRYIVDGEGVFGFTFPDGTQAELLVEAGEYINVPANAEHWFHLSSSRRIKAVRYFSGTEGWVPRYTGAEIQVSRLL
jgi:1,2-dihydroxy-3-keto-5-methylthiopentene dioxygenase